MTTFNILWKNVIVMYTNSILYKSTEIKIKKMNLRLLVISFRYNQVGSPFSVLQIVIAYHLKGLITLKYWFWLEFNQNPTHNSHYEGRVNLKICDKGGKNNI